MSGKIRRTRRPCSRGGGFTTICLGLFFLKKIILQENLTGKIEKTVRALNLAERFEAIGLLYRLLIPILERKNNFNVSLFFSRKIWTIIEIDRDRTLSANIFLTRII